MIHRSTTRAVPPPYSGRVSLAFAYAHGLITGDATVRALVAGFETVGGPIELAACLGKPRALPWLYFSIQSGAVLTLSSGSGGTARAGGPIEVAVAAVVAGTDPDHAVRILDAVADAIGRDYKTRTRFRAMWAQGVTKIVMDTYPTAIASGPEMTELRSAALGAVLIIL